MANAGPISQSYTRIILLDARLSSKASPIVAIVCQARLVRLRSNFIAPLDKLQRKAFACVPADVAVHQPLEKNSQHSPRKRDG